MARTAQMNVDKCNEFLEFLIDIKKPGAPTALRSLLDSLDENPFMCFATGFKVAMDAEHIHHKDLIIGLCLGVALSRGSNNPMLDDLLRHVHKMDQRLSGENVHSIFSAHKNK